SWIGALYIRGRAMGKFVGAMVGGTIGRAPQSVRRYLGLGLLPQAGVSIGLVYFLGERYSELSQQVAAVVLSAIVVNELVGPIAVRWAISKAGEGIGGEFKGA
ncbi:MAG: cation:proton antiporter, partial [bacterium]